MSRVFRALEKAEREKEEKTRVEPSLRIYRDETVSRAEVTIPRPPEQRKEKPELPAKEEVPILIPPSDSFAAEQFRKLRTEILLKSPNPRQIILVTSAVPQEGKTLVSLNLATTIAQDIQKKVILIDGDLRRPSIHLPNLQNSKGLSTYLSHEVPLSEILMKSEEENLWVIPAGPLSGNPSELLGSKRMEDLLLSLKESEGETFVIIDSAPILSASESVMLSRMVDAVILVVMADRTHREAVQRAMKSIDKQKLIGIVLNQMDQRPSSYYSAYHYKYYGKTK
ncbi:MAG: CpsD/CapB family tyrosine-protein kinase [Deltaproteobacteria bacterium]